MPEVFQWVVIVTGNPGVSQDYPYIGNGRGWGNPCRLQGNHGLGYGFEICYLPALKQAQYHAKQIRIDWDMIKSVLWVYFHHFSSVLDDFGLILQVMGSGMGYSHDTCRFTHAIPYSYT